MGAIQILEEVITQTKKNITSPNRKRAVIALKDLAAADGEAKIIAEYLVKFNYNISQLFFDEVVEIVDDKRLAQIVDALIINEQFQKGKADATRYPKGFISILSLAKAGKYQFSFSILNFILSKAEKTKASYEGCKNAFIKYVVNNEGMATIESIVKSVLHGNVTCNEHEKKRFNKFIEAIRESISGDKVIDTKTRTVSAQSQDIGTTVVAPKPEESMQNNIMVPIDAINRIESTQLEMLNLLRKLSSGNIVLDTLTAQLTSRDNEKVDIHAQWDDRDQQLQSAHAEISKLKENLAKSEGNASDLTRKLRTSLRMDEISKNQGLVTLKNDISEALKLDYSDFISIMNDDYSKDLFDVYRSTLKRIFKLLKRFGITCE